MRSPRQPLLQHLALRFMIGLVAALFGLAPSLAAQKFAQPTVNPTGSWPIAVYTADFNEDGYPDLLYIDLAANGASQMQLLLNDTHGGFIHSYLGGEYYKSLAVGDLLGNGHVDIGWVIGEGIGAGGPGIIVRILAGNGDGTFGNVHQAVVPFTNGVNDTFLYLKAVRLTQGGGLDLIAEDTNNNTLFTFHANQTPANTGFVFQNGFTAHTGIQLPDGPGPVTVMDLNADGNPELIVNGQTGFAANVFLGSATGIASNAVPTARITGLTGIHSMLLQDVNNDGRPDLIAEGTNGHLDVFAGNGNGTFQPTSSGGSGVGDGTVGAGGHLIALADLNHDGMLDALTATPAGISTMVGSVSASFALQGIYNAGPGHAAYAVADFNHDGNLDLAVDSPEGIAILYGNADATFQTSRAFAAGKPVTEAVLIGIDAVADLGAGPNGLLQGVGDGTFSAVVPYAPALPVLFSVPVPTGFTVSNTLISPGQMSAPVLSPTFGGTVATSAGGLGFPASTGSIAVADLDGDGNVDLIVTYANLAADRTAPTASAPNYIYIWFGSGGGKFLTSATHPKNPVVITPSRNFYQVAVADVTGDKIPDLILSDGYVLSVQSGKGDGTFGAETHFLAGQGLNTISVADLNNDGKLDLVVANGGTVWGNPVANLEQPPAAQDVNTGGITVLLNHATQPIATITASVTASPEPSTFGNAFTVTATITPSATNNNPVTGTFTFAVDGVIAGTATISGLTATLPIPASIYAGLTVGSHTLTAVYSGDPNWPTGTFSGTHNVSLIPTSTGLLLCVDQPSSNFPCGNPITSTPLISPISMYYGQSVDGVAIESGLNLTGTITFYSGASTFCVLNANLQQGSQTCPPNSGVFPAGTTTVTAVYSGDSVHATSTSNPIVVTVLQDPTTTTVTSSLNPATFGQAVGFTVSVQGNFAPGAGQVLLLDGNTTIGTATLDATGHALILTSALSVGTHLIRYAFPGSANFLSSTSAPLSQVILPPATPVPSIVTLSSSVNPSTPGQSVTFTATVTLTAPYTIFPVGNVTFLDGSNVIGTGLVSALTGQATFSTSTLAVGSHPITASYPGLTGNGTTTATILPSTSAPLTQVVGVPTPPSFTLTVAPAPVTIGAGDTGILLVKVQALGGFNQAVKLTCTGLPQETTCSFVQPVMPAGGGSTTLQVAVSAPHSCDNNTPYFVSSTSETGTTAKVLLAGLFGGGLLFAGIRRRRKLLAGTIFLALLSLAGFATISGCGACTDLGTKPGVYSFTVVGTATASTEVESQKIPLTVTIP